MSSQWQGQWVPPALGLQWGHRTSLALGPEDWALTATALALWPCQMYPRSCRYIWSGGSTVHRFFIEMVSILGCVCYGLTCIICVFNVPLQKPSNLNSCTTPLLSQKNLYERALGKETFGDLLLKVTPFHWCQGKDYSACPLLSHIRRSPGL